MGQVLHGSASTTQAIRRAIQHSQESIRALARRHGINPKTVVKWRRRTSTSDAPMGPKTPRSTVLSQAEEAIIVAFRKHTLLPLDDCLYALQSSIPHLTRSALHRCLQRHGISRLPEIEGEKPSKKKFKTYPIGFVLSTSPRCVRRKASCSCSSPSIARRSSPSLGWLRRPTPRQPSRSSTSWSKQSPTRSMSC